MREIKFRAWDKENEKMMKVSSLHLENKEISVKENGTFRLFRMQDLMQFTGVKDKTFPLPLFLSSPVTTHTTSCFLISAFKGNTEKSGVPINTIFIYSPYNITPT